MLGMKLAIIQNKVYDVSYSFVEYYELTKTDIKANSKYDLIIIIEDDISVDKIKYIEVKSVYNNDNGYSCICKIELEDKGEVELTFNCIPIEEFSKIPLEFDEFKKIINLYNKAIRIYEKYDNIGLFLFKNYAVVYGYDRINKNNLILGYINLKNSYTDILCSISPILPYSKNPNKNKFYAVKVKHINYCRFLTIVDMENDKIYMTTIFPIYNILEFKIKELAKINDNIPLSSDINYCNDFILLELSNLIFLSKGIKTIYKSLKCAKVPEKILEYKSKKKAFKYGEYKIEEEEIITKDDNLHTEKYITNNNNLYIEIGGGYNFICEDKVFFLSNVAIPIPSKKYFDEVKKEGNKIILKKNNKDYDIYEDKDYYYFSKIEFDVNDIFDPNSILNGCIIIDDRYFKIHKLSKLFRAKIFKQYDKRFWYIFDYIASLLALSYVRKHKNCLISKELLALLVLDFNLNKGFTFEDFQNLRKKIIVEIKNIKEPLGWKEKLVNYLLSKIPQKYDIDDFEYISSSKYNIRVIKYRGNTVYYSKENINSYLVINILSRADKIDIENKKAYFILDFSKFPNSKIFYYLLKNIIM